jgi:TonB family protein
MRRVTLTAGSIVLIICLNSLLISAPRPQNDDSSARLESPDGLKSFLEELFGAMKSGSNTDAYFSSLQIPDHRTWFTTNFGAEGMPLNARYEELLPEPVSTIRGHFDFALKDGRTNVEVRMLQQPPNPNDKRSLAIINAMVQHTTIYNVMGTSPQQKYALLIGDFVYVDGRFRYLDPRVFDILSGTPPVRVKVGGQVQAAKLTHRVDPVYPAEAKARHLTGTVVLHVIIGTNGTIMEVAPTSGDATLSLAAVEAVKQWKYQPTLLNSLAVEVDTTISVTFALN